MSFTTDKQTLEDLDLLGKYKPNSIFSIFNKVNTSGGERLLGEMFKNPMTDAPEINHRSKLFKYFHEKQLQFPIKRGDLQAAENYLGIGTSSNFISSVVTFGYQKALQSLVGDKQHQLIMEGLLATIKMLNQYHAFLCQQNDESVYREERESVMALFLSPKLAFLSKEENSEGIRLLDAAKYNFALKNTLRDELEAILASLYRLDVYTTVSGVARINHFHYATALPKNKNLLQASALRHPGLIDGVPNPIDLDKKKNMMFLTGANMAGKSTFMKSFGIAVYLAHMGFPVAAENLLFSVGDGLYSSINVSDDLTKGYSHFYAEVLRVKTISEEVAAGKTLFVLFDELFKGTNVKDAYDGTLSVTAAFSKYRKCFFIISTHIIEVGEELKKKCNTMQFSYLPTVMEGSVPRYTYKMTEGITTDRQGMMIIENEGILEIIRGLS